MSIIRQLVGAVRGGQISGTVRSAKREVIRKYKEYRSFDRIYGLDTGGIIEPAELQVPSHNRGQGTAYQPTPTKLCRKAVADLSIDHTRYVFVDMGSGKGRMLLLASSYPFKKIIGVEFSPELHQIALRNIATYRSRKQRCRQIESICLDAADYVPPAEPTVFFFFNPFGPGLMRRVLSNVRESIRLWPRDVVFVYYNPLHAHVFDEFGFGDSLIQIEVVEGVDSAWANL